MIRLQEPKNNFEKWDQEQYHKDLIHQLQKKTNAITHGLMVQCAKEVSWKAALVAYDLKNINRINKELMLMLMEQEKELTVLRNFYDSICGKETRLTRFASSNDISL